MTPRLRKLLTLLVATGIFLGGVTVVVRQVLLNSFEQLEKQATLQSSEQVVKALQAEVSQIAVVAKDYASWDEMYAFVRQFDPKFVEGNFSKLGLREMECDIAFIVDENDRDVFSVEQRITGGYYSTPASASAMSALRQQLKQIKDALGSTDRISMLRLPDGLAVFTARPIIKTDRTGPARGLLVMVRKLSAKMRERMASVSQLPVNLWDMDSAAAPVAGTAEQLPASIRDWATALHDNAQRQVRPRSSADVDGFAALLDAAGKPALVVGTRTPRAVYQQGLQTLRYLLVSIITLALLGIGVAVVLDARLQRSSRRAREREVLYRAVVEQSEEGILLLDPERQAVLECNPAFTQITGYGSETLRDSSIDAVVDPGSLPLFWSIIAPEPDALYRPPVELMLRRADGSPIEAEVSANNVVIDERNLVCLLVRDVSQRKNAEARLLDHQRKLEHLENHDALTGLPNRLYLGITLPGLIQKAARESKLLALCYIDIDNFKHVNDSSGHNIGDEFLRAVAERLRSVVSRDDLVARISGDEFVVVSQASQLTQFESIAKRITEHLRTPLTFDSRVFTTSVSVGLAVYPRDAMDASELLRTADIALFQAKQGGRNNFRFFSSDMTARVNERIVLEQALRDGLAQGQLSVHFQPVVKLRSERIVGLEALARWHHPELGNIPPSQFIPVAEDAGLIVDLGENVLRQVCAQIAAWSAAGLPVVPVAVNVSAQQLLHTDISLKIPQICAEFAVSPRLIQIEITESVVMRELDRHISTIAKLRSTGVRVSIDDFGTGYSSLSYLKHLPIDHLKIDRSFVRDMAVDSNDAAIVSAIISMAKSLRLETIAEGVETAQHAMRLAALGCDLAQGYYYSGPVPAAECAAMLQDLARRTPHVERQRPRFAHA